MKPVDVFRIYHTLHLHFQGRFDYVKYNGRMPHISKIFLKRHDRYFFEKIARHYASEEIEGLFLSLMVEDPNYRIAQYDPNHVQEVYVAWKKRNQRLLNYFHNDLIQLKKLLKDNDLTFKDLFTFKEQKHPTIVRLYMQGLIIPETFVILSVIMGFKPHYDKVYDDTIWKGVSSFITYYLPFIKYDYEVFKKTVQKVF